MTNEQLQELLNETATEELRWKRLCALLDAVLDRIDTDTVALAVVKLAMEWPCDAKWLAQMIEDNRELLRGKQES